jgi:hypothetical protein
MPVNHCLARGSYRSVQMKSGSPGEERIEGLLAGPVSGAGTTSSGLHVTASAIQVKSGRSSNTQSLS